MSPGEKLKEFLEEFVKKNNLSVSLLKEIPKKWEKYGDFVLFDERTFLSEVWKKQNDDFWFEIAKILKCNRIGLKNKIKNDSFRTPNVKILLGNNPWILHRDNSILYSWNVEKSMFSAGNACEKLRIAKLNCQNEVVVDLFAGIGYFTLPFLIHANASYVHACEWNPAAIEALKRNLVLNKVQNKCLVYEGDSLITCPKKVANRINLGLIPSSESHWKTACEALVDEGGVLHIHENVETKKDEIFCKDCLALQIPELLEKNIWMSSNESFIKTGNLPFSWKHKQWIIKAVHILHSLLSILYDMNSASIWDCCVEHINFVKSYAPRVNHLVFDVKVKNRTLFT